MIQSIQNAWTFLLSRVIYHCNYTVYCNYNYSPSQSSKNAIAGDRGFESPLAEVSNCIFHLVFQSCVTLWELAIWFIVYRHSVEASIRNYNILILKLSPDLMSPYWNLREKCIKSTETNWSLGRINKNKHNLHYFSMFSK